ncbi:MAG: hypothetical protein NTZ05_21390 [Chloroflexi bacterium]|nr:hypothetical protein [Chloroflexota bacterium]
MRSTMHVVHGTWIPDETGEYVQRGGFYLWVETDAPQRGRRSSSDQALHPRHLLDASLVQFLEEKLGLRDSGGKAMSGALCRRFFLLPTADGAPLPSFELQHYVEQEIPGAFALRSWRICCYPLPDVMRSLNDIHFAALNAAEDFQLGADLLFWRQYSQVLKQVIAREQYIPAITYHELAPAPGKRSKKPPAFEVKPGWEMLSRVYEAALPDYAAAMPLLCAAGSASPSATVFAKESLLRHFGESLLQDVVTNTPLTAKHDQQLAGTFLYRAMYPERPDARPPTPDAALAEYRAWAGWRAKLTQAQTAAGFTLGFQLEEPPAGAGDWRLHFQAAAKSDPSHWLRLADYWESEPSARTAAVRAFGADKNTSCSDWVTPRGSPPNSGADWRRANRPAYGSRWKKPLLF